MSDTFLSPDLAEVARQLSVLADSQRLHILDLLIQGVHCSSAIATRLDLAPNLVSHHLKVLRDEGLIDVERDPADRRWIYHIPNVQKLTEVQFTLSQFLHPVRIRSRVAGCGPQHGAQPYAPPTHLAIEKEPFMSTNKAKIIFLCTGNSARSQMAEAFMRRYAGDLFEVHSAGLEPRGVNTYTVQVLEEVGIDTSDFRSKSVREYLGHMNFGYVVTVCDHAEENCPTVFLSQGHHYHWSSEEPARFEGNDEETLTKFREVRDLIDAKIKAFAEEYRQEALHRSA